jgi:hypothetical protein
MDGESPEGEVKEPDNSTVDDWFGQNAARDAEVADKAAAENDDPEAAEAQFEREADGQERYEEGHPRPDGAARS